MRFQENERGKLRKSTLTISGQRMRLDTDGARSYRLANLATWEVLDVDDARRLVLITPVRDLYERTKFSMAKKTDARKALLGRTCDVWQVPTKGAEMCADPTIPGFLLFLRHAGYRGALELGGGPLPLLVTPPPDAREERSLRVLRIEPKPIPADRFVAPDGYQRAPVQMVGLYDDVRRVPLDEHP